MYKNRRKNVDNKIYEYMIKPKIHASLAYFWFTLNALSWVFGRLDDRCISWMHMELNEMERF